MDNLFEQLNKLIEELNSIVIDPADYAASVKSRRLLQAIKVESLLLRKKISENYKTAFKEAKEAKKNKV